MILEALNYAASWPLTPRAFRPFLSSSVSLWSRAQRCAAEWRGHEENTRRAVAETVARLPMRRSCVVLGSGLMRDMPVRLLGEAFDTVILVDLVHLASTRVRLSRQGGRTFRLIHRDVSGFEAIRKGEAADPLAFLAQVPYLDLVISANLLSQLAIGAGRRLDRDEPGLGDEAREALLRRVVEAHLEGLQGLSCPALLVSDVGFEIVNRQGAVEDRVDLTHGATLPEAEKSWDWPVAPMGEASKNYALRHRVIAHLFHAPRRPTP